ncbi:MAG TPA: hypothetical protein VM364_10290 [Vicinamibacterales bacterium]|nr:hypothetical protein [Vicinamibacterales bacterium]
MTDGRFKLGAWLVAEDRNRAFDGSTEVENPLRERTRILVPLVTADLRVTPRFGLQFAASLPNVTRTAVVPRATGPFNYRENFSGLGDTSVVGWYRLPPLRGWTPMVNVGASLPTGRTETPRFRPELQGGNLVPMSRLQRGSGTIDPILGLNLNWGRDPWTRFVTVAARTPVYENEDGLRTGSAVEISAGAARYAPVRKIGLFGRVSWLHRQQDVFRGTPVLVGGGNWVYFTPGIGVLAGRRLNLQAEVKLPLYRSLSNTQLDSRAIVQFGISRSF